MPIEQQVVSIAEAVIAARQAVRDGRIIPVSPCVQVDSAGQTTVCPKMDKTLGTLCTNPDGPLAAGRGIECPLQRGSIVITDLLGSVEINPSGLVTSGVNSDRKERRPYFVK